LGEGESSAQAYIDPETLIYLTRSPGQNTLDQWAVYEDAPRKSPASAELNVVIEGTAHEWREFEWLYVGVWLSKDQLLPVHLCAEQVPQD